MASESLWCRTVRFSSALAWCGALLTISGCGKTWHAPVDDMPDVSGAGGNGSVTPGNTNSGGNSSGAGAGTPGEGIMPGPIASAGAPGSGGSASVGAMVDCSIAGTAPVNVQWDAINGQAPTWYATAEALSLADNILYYQNENRGWPKNIDMTTRTPARDGSSTIDNSGTTTQIDYLARVYTASGCTKYGDAAVAGIQYLLDGQYGNGGWPQRFPDPEGYPAHITFNDNAMVHVLELLREVSRRTGRFAFVDEALATESADAVERGIGCILATQVVSDGVKTGWCAQHDEVTLAPAQARTYELPSLSGSEGAGLFRFLMTIEDPSPEVREAVNGAATWFEKVKLTGIKIERVVDATLPEGEDRVVVEDPAAPPLWARFYELGTDRPIFSSRCEVDECDADPFFMRRYNLAEIENERRVGYAWYGNWPNQPLSQTYPQWKARWGE